MFAIECFGITDGPFENFDTAFRTLFERIGYVVLADTVMGFAVNDRCFMSLTHGSETFETGFDELEAMAKALGVIKDDRLRGVSKSKRALINRLAAQMFQLKTPVFKINT